MSLDVYLEMPGVTATGTGIFIREDGAVREITRTEWNERFPGKEPVIALRSDKPVYSANITHNLGKMAQEAGVYQVVWRPDENGIIIAEQLLEPLRAGLSQLRQNPTYFKQFNPENGWGDYEAFVRFISEYLVACEDFPTATVRVWR